MTNAPKELTQELDKPFGDRVIEPLQQRALARSAAGSRARTPPSGSGASSTSPATRPAGPSTGCCPARCSAPSLGLLFGAGVLADARARRPIEDPHDRRRRRSSGFFAPNLYLYQRAYERSERLQRELPDAIDLLTISVESGLGFDAAVQQVARNTDGPLVRRVLPGAARDADRPGPRRRAAGLAERTNVADVRTFVGAMVQADSFGIPMAQVLRVQSAEMRVKRRQRAEEKAQQVPVKITIPLIFCILPDPVHRGHGTGRAEHHGQLQQVIVMRVRERQHVELSAAARAFVLVALLGPVLWTQDTAALVALITIGAVWALGTLADWRQRLPVMRGHHRRGGDGRARSAASRIHSSLAVLGALAVPAVHRRPLPLRSRASRSALSRPADRRGGASRSCPSTGSAPTRGSARSAGA